VLHPVALTLWVVAAAAAALGTRNPIYLALLLGVVWATYSTARRYNPRARWGSILKLGLWVWGVTIPFNALSSHMGRYVIFTLPRTWPVIGGPVTVEGVLFGFLNGFSLVLLLTTFAAFNTAVEQHELLRLVPSAFYHAGMIASIAVTFVPVMTTTFEDIRQAQTLRGHRFRGLRDLLPLIAPLLASALERSIQLAEAMEARGYGSGIRPLSPRRNAILQMGLLLGLLALTGGLFVRAYYPTARTLGAGLSLAAGAGIVAILWYQGRRVHRSYYRVWHWDVASRVIAMCSAISLAVLLTVDRWSATGLVYYPYPPNEILPAFDHLIALALLILVAPAVMWQRAIPREAIHVSG
jgi:energy-coupling factor transport system permease protein